MTTEKQKVTVTIGGRKFVFNVAPENVQKVKDTAQKVRGLEASYAAKFPDKDMQDILSLVVMDIAMAQA